MDRTDFATRANLIMAINGSDDAQSKDSLDRAMGCRAKRGEFYCPACIFSYQSAYIPYSHGVGDVDFNLNNRICDVKYPLYHFIIAPQMEIINGVKTIKITDSENLYNFKTPKRPRFYETFDEYSASKLHNLRHWYKLVYRSDLPSFTDMDTWIVHMKNCHFSNEEFLPWENGPTAVRRVFKKFRNLEGVTRTKQYPPLDFDISRKLIFTEISTRNFTGLADLVNMGVQLYDPMDYMTQPNGVDWASLDISNRLRSNLYMIFAHFIRLGGFYKTGESLDAKLFSITTCFRFMRTLIRTARFPMTTDPESFKMLAHYVILDETYKVVFQRKFGKSFNEHQNWSVLEQTQKYNVDWQFFPRDLTYHFPHF